MSDKANTGPGSAASPLRTAVAGLLAVAACVGAGLSLWRQANPPDPYAVDLSKPFQFVDNAASNVPLDAVGMEDLSFMGVDGRQLALDSFAGRKNVVLVVTRGNTSGRPPGAYRGRICLYCASQTSRLIANYAAIRDRNAEVVVVFPIERESEKAAVGEFDAAVRADSLKFDRLRVDKAPFPVVLDVERKMVDRLGLRADLAKPATYIIDTAGRVRFAHVGQSLADRPSVQCILDQLAAIETPADSPP